MNNTNSKYQLKNIRGKGLLLAFDLPDNKGSEVVDSCLKEGLLLNSPKPATIRLNFKVCFTMDKKSNPSR